MLEKRSSTPILKRLLFAILLISVGFVIGFFSGNIKKEIYHSLQEQLQSLDVDSLKKIHNTSTLILIQKEKPQFDSLKLVTNIRDSLLVIKGMITSTMRSLNKKSDAYNSLDSLRYDINQMISYSDQIIMNQTLDLLKPVNNSLKALIKEIKTKTEKLQNIAKTLATVSEIINAITSILGSPILAPVDSPTPGA